MTLDPSCTDCCQQNADGGYTSGKYILTLMYDFLSRDALLTVRDGYRSAETLLERESEETGETLSAKIIVQEEIQKTNTTQAEADTRAEKILRMPGG